MKYVIYGKDNCSYCEKAKNLLTIKKLEFEYLTLDKDYTREELLDLAPDARTVPQIWLENKGELLYIGGYTQLEATFVDPVEIALNEGLTISVVFTKVDGSERTMLCTKNFQYIPEEKKPTTDSESKATNVMKVFDLEKQDWRSFRLESVKSFTIVEEE